MKRPLPLAEPQTVRHRLSDGVELAATLWRPVGDGPFPVLLMRQPYGRAIASTIVLAHPAWYAAQGYVVVIQDVRGTGDSGGDLSVLEHEAADGAEAVAWAAGLPGSTGQVGMYGFSYQGATQLLAFSRAPEGLAAIAPAMSGWTIRTDWASENRAYHLAMGIGWALQLGAIAARHRGDRDAFAAIKAAAAAPPFHGPIPAQPAILETLRASHPHRDWSREAEDSPYWQTRAPADLIQKDAPSIPVLHVGGWYDLMLTGTLGAFQDMGRSNHELLVGPWAHIPWNSLVGAVDFGPAAASVVDGALIRFFDRVLKGEGAAPEARVRLFDLGTRSWRGFADWPRQKDMPLFLASDGNAALRPDEGALLEAPAAAMADRIVHDPWQPVPALGGHAAPLCGMHDRAGIDARADVLTYTSLPLQKALTIAGDIAAEFFVSSDALDFDLDAVLALVEEDGRVLNLVQGYARIGDRAAWPLRLPMRASLITIAAGKRLRLSLAGACFPAFAVNPGTGTSPTEASAIEAVPITIALHSGPNTPSRLILPILD